MRFAPTQRWWLASEMSDGDLLRVVRCDGPGPSPQPTLQTEDRIRRRDSLSTAPASLITSGRQYFCSAPKTSPFSTAREAASNHANQESTND